LRLPLFLSALSLVAAGAAVAQPAVPAAPPVSSAPATAAKAAPVTKLDTQLFISPMGEPFRATDGQPYPIADWFAGADTNKDGQITRSEFRADALRFFKTLDVNGDGKLNEDEIVRYEKRVAPEIVDATVDTSGAQAIEDANGHKANIQLFSTQGATYYGLINSPEPVRAADSDFNRKVTQDEWMSAADRRFRLLAGEDKDSFKLSDLPTTPFLNWYRKQPHGG
jgi:hypothetical protein